ncbi:uncharacterized protein LOC128920035 isoform X2 [Zeugodacus cucurbitae]|uniref:uncharacterized protein LOC128920035 isoform X2 n=1 Tax=Zeugodacus cucurbitae TaxID=28588 RepID=UPI0023D93DC6|nr:uncharacterized protein LOC128920035 isoform X2 [Zeugodacus cucurbitae]
MEMRLVYLLMVLIICIGIEAAKIPINMDSDTYVHHRIFSRSSCPKDHRGRCIETSTIINRKYIEFESGNPTTETSSARQKAIHESSAIVLNCPKDHRGRCIETSTIMNIKHFEKTIDNPTTESFEELLNKIFNATRRR